MGFRTSNDLIMKIPQSPVVWVLVDFRHIQVENQDQLSHTPQGLMLLKFHTTGWEKGAGYSGEDPTSCVPPITEGQ